MLPAGVAGIGLRQPLGDGEAVAIGLQRSRKVALRHLHVADLVVRHRQIALPAGVAGIGLRQPLPDGEAVAIGFQRSRKVALRHLHIADLVVSGSEAVLIVGVVGVRGGERGQEVVGFLSAGAFLGGVAQDCVIAGELDQHPRLLILQLRRRPAVARHVVKQGFRFGE